MLAISTILHLFHFVCRVSLAALALQKRVLVFPSFGVGGPKKGQFFSSRVTPLLF